MRHRHGYYHHSYAQCERTVSASTARSLKFRQKQKGSTKFRNATQPKLWSALLKEVIQPQVPLRLPCYDFTPVADLAVDATSLAVRYAASGTANSHGVTGGVYKARERIHRGMLIRDY